VKSINELRISGGYREDRHGDRVETPKPLNAPEAPRHLSRSEKIVFTEISELMFENNSIAKLDVYALEAISIQICLLRKARKELAKTGEYIMPYTNKNGSTNLVPNPWLQVMKNATDAIIKLSAKLGATPMDRAKISKVAEGNKEGENSLLR
jgi:P27 family predicted phage terminase small subunit